MHAYAVESAGSAFRLGLGRILPSEIPSSGVRMSRHQKNLPVFQLWKINQICWFLGTGTLLIVLKEPVPASLVCVAKLNALCWMGTFVYARQLAACQRKKPAEHMAPESRCPIGSHKFLLRFGMCQSLDGFFLHGFSYQPKRRKWACATGRQRECLPSFSRLDNKDWERLRKVMYRECCMCLRVPLAVWTWQAASGRVYADYVRYNFRSSYDWQRPFSLMRY